MTNVLRAPGAPLFSSPREGLRTLGLGLCVLVDALLLFTVGALAAAIALPILRWRGARLKRTWKRGGPGREVCHQPGVVQAYRLHGDSILEHFLTPDVDHSAIFDPCAPEDFEVQKAEGRLSIVGWRQPAIHALLNRLMLRECAMLARELAVAFRMQSWIVEQNFDFVRSFQHEYAALRAQWICDSLGIPHIVEVAGNYQLLRHLTGRAYFLSTWSRAPLLWRISHVLNDVLLGYAMKRAWRVFGRNKNNYEHAFALGAPVERLSLVRIRMNVGFFDLKGGTAERPRPWPYLLYVARMVTEKFPFDVLAVFEQIAAEFPDLRLVVIGGGPLEQPLREAAAKTACGDRVEVLGARANTEVIGWTRHAAIAFETYSAGSLVEKMLCEVPIACYDVEWMSEVVIDGYTGLLCDFRDTRDAADRCRTLLREPERAKAMARRAKEFALIVFDRASIIAKEARYYREAIRVSREGVL